MVTDGGWVMADEKGIRTVIYLKPGESVLVVKEDSYYKLGYPVEDIMLGHTLKETTLVSWDELSQQWIT